MHKSDVFSVLDFYYKLDHCIMHFKSFHWLIAIMGYEPLYHALLKYSKRTRDCFGFFILI